METTSHCALALSSFHSNADVFTLVVHQRHQYSDTKQYLLHLDRDTAGCDKSAVFDTPGNWLQIKKGNTAVHFQSTFFEAGPRTLTYLNQVYMILLMTMIMP